MLAPDAKALLETGRVSVGRVVATGAVGAAATTSGGGTTTGGAEAGTGAVVVVGSFMQS
jgi:hypothetical protein